MEDETTKPEDQITDEQVTNPVEKEVVESTEQTQVDPLRLSPEMQSRHKSAADLETFAKEKQGEAQRLQNEFDDYRRQNPQPSQQTSTATDEEVLDRLAKDPIAFVREVTSDIRAQVALTEFARTHPDMETYKAGMKGIVERNQGVLNDPQGLEMVYLLAKNQGDATKLTQAAEIKTAHNAQVLAEKQTTAVIEGATTPQPASSSKVTLGMSPEESADALKAQGIPDATDEDRIN